MVAAANMGVQQMWPRSFWAIGPGVVAGCGLFLVLGGGCRGQRPAASAGDGIVVLPGQPAAGPGGGDYVHAKVNSARFGDGGDQYWLFQPADPEPAEAPVVVFLHGFGGIEPRSYGSWIQHIVRKGHIVIYPRYQASLLSPIAEMQDNALRAVLSAWEKLNSEGSVRPRSDKMAWVGHSFGGILATNLSAAFEVNGLPQPGALMLVQPAGTRQLEVASLEGLPDDTLALLILGDADNLVTEAGVGPYIDRLLDLPGGNVEMITIRSDDRGPTPLVADHLSPLAVDPTFPPDSSGSAAKRTRWGRRKWQIRGQLPQVDAPPDALDFYGYWKLLDGLLDASFRGKNREFALGNTPEQRFMGRLSNGAAVTPLLVKSLETVSGP